MASEAERAGRRRIAALVSAAAWAKGWTDIATAADKCDMSRNTYSAVVNNADGEYRPSDETLKKFTDSLGLDPVLLAELRLGQLSPTGDPALDKLIALVAEKSPDQRSQVEYFAGLPDEQCEIVYMFVRQLTASLRAS